MRSTTLTLLWILVIAVVAGVVIGNWLMWHAVGRPDRFLDAIGVTVVQAIIAAAPFLIFAMTCAAPLRASESSVVSRQLLLAALEAFAITAVLWGLYFRDGYRAWTPPTRGGGANIGLGMVMLVSPLVAAVPLVIGHRAARRSIAMR